MLSGYKYGSSTVLFSKVRNKLESLVLDGSPFGGGSFFYYKKKEHCPGDKITPLPTTAP